MAGIKKLGSRTGGIQRAIAPSGEERLLQEEAIAKGCRFLHPSSVLHYKGFIGDSKNPIYSLLTQYPFTFPCKA
jgi:hypothetical protein